MKVKLEEKNCRCEERNLPVAAFAGNPNVGKSSVFNILTGMHQHTGNWSGKTVGNTVGKTDLYGKKCLLADLPGAYSLEPESFEEEAARDFIVFCKPELLVYVCGALSLERNLIMLMQISEFCDNIILCVNMTDELAAQHKKIDIDFLEKTTGIRTVALSAKKKRGIAELKKAIANSIGNKTMSPRKLLYDETTEDMIEELLPQTEKLQCAEDISVRAATIRFLCNDMSFITALKEIYPSDEAQIINIENSVNKLLNKNNFNLREAVSDTLADRACRIVSECISETSYDSKVKGNKSKHTLDSKYKSADSILTGKFLAYPVMLLLLILIFWITISAANAPSETLNNMFSYFEPYVLSFLTSLGIPSAITEMLVFGVYRVVTWIIAVMLPPMAIFFPMFTLLEDSGYLPRIAFNLDRTFCSCGACGKQALTMCMGFGCNAVGVSGCRIIGSERERLIAILTNSFSPCNGRFPILIAIIAMFAGNIPDIGRSFILTAMIAFSIFMSLAVSKILSSTILKGKSSSFILELPPYRIPQIGSVIVRSLIDRTFFVLLRAVTVAAPCGLIIWILANITVGETTLLLSVSEFLNPIAAPFGLDGVILFAFILGLPANEIVIPIIMMSYLASGSLAEYESISALKTIFADNGWTIKTAVCTCAFTLMHWPCATTLMTVARETKSIKTTILSFIIPTVSGLCVCLVLNILFSLFGY